MIPMTRDRPDVLDVDAHDRKVAMPAGRVERIERISYDRDCVVALDAHLPRAIVALLRDEGSVHRRNIEHRRIEDCVRAEHALVRQRVAGVRGFDEHRGQRLLRLDPPHRAARNDDIVAGGEREMAIVAMQVARALMQEQQIVTIRVAHKMIHRRRCLPEANAHVAIAQYVGGIPRRALRARQLVQIERMRPHRTFERCPARRRMLVMEERSGPEEPFLADLALVRAGGQVGMRLARGRALDARNEDRPLHVTALLTTRRGASGRARSIRTAPGNCLRRSPRCPCAG